MALPRPLPYAILDDPAFSLDPRSHPHFPLANALPYRTPPSKSPLIPHLHLPSSPSASSLSDSDSLAFPSPTISSATSHSSHSRRSSAHSPVASLSPSPSPPTKPKVIYYPPPLPLPVPPKPASTYTLPRQALKPVQTNIPRKARMKAFVRRLTTRNNLDRIDELDETDPFGSSYHHDGPYEAISNNLAQSTIPYMNGNPPSRRSNIHHSTREPDPPPSRPSHHQFTSRVPFTHGEAGLSLHLEPGQILQQNTIYTSHASSIAAFPPQFHPQPNTVSTTRPSRRQSAPNPQTLSPPDPSPLGSRVGYHQSLSLRAPPERYLGEYAPDIRNGPPIDHDHDAAPYVLHQPENTVIPPPRYESRLHNLGPPRSPPRTPPPPPFNPTSPKTQSTENMVPTLLRTGPRHKTVHSLDSSHTAINSTFVQPSSGIQNKPVDRPRIRHLPKRLVMPAPLQPLAPQSQYSFPPVEPSAWQDEYPDHHTLEGVYFEGKHAKYSQEPRLLRKKSSAFPAKVPIPNIVPMSQDDAVPIMGYPLAKTANEVGGTKERARRRRLSKRKNDI